MDKNEKLKELEYYIGKNVRIILKDGQVCVGKVDDTSEAEYNQRPFKSIEIWVKNKGGFGFYEDEIQEIEIL